MVTPYPTYTSVRYKSWLVVLTAHCPNICQPRSMLSGACIYVVPLGRQPPFTTKPLPFTLWRLGREGVCEGVTPLV